MKSKILYYSVVNKYPLFCFIAGMISVVVGMQQNLMTKEILVMASVFGVLMLLTIAGIYFTRYFVVKNIIETLAEQKQVPATLNDANTISFIYKENDYKLNLYSNRGSTFALFYKNEKLVANKAINYKKESLVKIIDLLDTDKPLSKKKYKLKMKSKWL